MYLNKFLCDTNNSKNNYHLGSYYYDKSHYSAAACFYLRSADRSVNIIRYNSLIMTALCYKHLGDRYGSIETLLKEAVCEIPSRPEAYFLLCELYDDNKDWVNCYFFSELALSKITKNKKISNCDYPGIYSIKIFKAISSWQLGKTEKAINLLMETLQNNIINDYFSNKISYYLTKIFYDKNHTEDIN